jgi:hypothetical protein
MVDEAAGLQQARIRPDDDGAADILGANAIALWAQRASASRGKLTAALSSAWAGSPIQIETN